MYHIFYVYVIYWAYNATFPHSWKPLLKLWMCPWASWSESSRCDPHINIIMFNTLKNAYIQSMIITAITKLLITKHVLYVAQWILKYRQYIYIYIYMHKHNQVEQNNAQWKPRHKCAMYMVYLIEDKRLIRLLILPIWIVTNIFQSSHFLKAC